MKRLKSAADYNREQNKSPERSANGERRLSNDEVVEKYFGILMAKIATDGDDETYEARVNQADMDEEEPNERPMDNITDVMMKAMMGTSTSTLDSRLAIKDNGKKKRMQIDSGCCGMSMLSSPAYFCYGLADGKKINIHTAEKVAARKAKAYGIAAGSVPTLTDLKTREAGPRKAIRTGLAVCDDAIHDLVNENRFDINLDGTPTPHRVDKKNRCIWMYHLNTTGTPST